jgi:hypothetical protein
MVFSASRVANSDKRVRTLSRALRSKEIMINAQLSFARCAAQGRSSVLAVGVQPRHRVVMAEERARKSLR